MAATNTESNSPKAKNENPVDSTNLYIKGLWKDCTQIELDDLFKPFGIIRQSRVYGDGIGFVRYELPEQAAAAVNLLHGKKVHVKSVQPLIVRFAHHKCRQPKSVIEMGEQTIEMLVHENTKNVYIRGLPLYFSESDLFSLCSHFGIISCIRLCKNGVAFVRYSSGCQARNAIHGLHGKFLANNFTPLLVKLANSDPFEPRIEFRNGDGCQAQSENSIPYSQQINPQVTLPAGLNQMNNTLNNLNIMNLGNSLNCLNLSPTNSSCLINVPNICNPQLQNQFSNTSLNSLNLNLLRGTNSNTGPYPLNNDIFGVAQQLASSSIGVVPLDSKIAINGALNQNAQKEKHNAEKQNTDNNRDEEDDGSDEIVYLGYEDEEEEEEVEENIDGNDNDQVIGCKTSNDSPKTNVILEKTTSNKNSVSTGDMVNNISFSSSICSLITNNTSNTSLNNVATPTQQINANSENKLNLTNNNSNTTPFINLNPFLPTTQLCNLNYTNWPQYSQPQGFAPTLFPGLIGINSNTSDINNPSGNFGYFSMPGMQPDPMQFQQVQFPQNLKQDLGNNNSFFSISPAGNFGNNATLSPTSNVNFPLSLPLLQNSNSFQFYVPTTNLPNQ